MSYLELTRERIRAGAGDYLVNGNTNEKAQQTLKDAELIKEFQKIEELPQEEKNTILKVISAYIRDFKTKQSYTL